MTARDPGPGPRPGAGAMPADLDRLLADATVPAMSAGLIDRIVAEAARPDRIALPVARPARSRGRRWTRRGVWTGIVAVNVMLATAVAAAFGGGALTFAKIAVVAHHVVEHLRAPFHHAAPRVAPARPVGAAHPVPVHRLAVPAAAILTAPRVAMPMTAPRSLAGPRVATRPRFQPAMPVRHLAHPVRSPDIDARTAAPGPRPVAHGGPRLRPHETPRHAGMGRGEEARSRLHAEARAPIASPMAPRVDPLPRAEGALGRDAPAAERGLQGDGTRADGARGQASGTARPRDRADDRPGVPGQGVDRAPGWRRRMQGGNPGMNGPGWRRRAGQNGGGAAQPGGRMKPPRPGGGGRRPRRF